MTKGLCAACGKLRWIKGQGGLCKPCSYPTGPCAQCEKLRKLYVDSLYYVCYQDRQVRSLLLEKEVEWTPKLEYPKYLFHLYLIYLRRYLLQYCHLKQAEQISKVLSQNPPSPILSWMQVYELSERDQALYSRTAQRGCAWMKIGFMLQELGVLPPHADEKGREFRAILQTFSSTELDWIKPFIDDLRRSGRAEGTILNQLQSIRDLLSWLRNQSLPATLLQVNSLHLQDYLVSLKQKNSSLIFLRKHARSLHRFYRGCLARKLILSNPCENIVLSREAPRLPVCSPEQIQKLYKFVKSPNSPAEAALMVALVLFFGFTSEDLAHAQLTSASEVPIVITLRRRSRTKGRRYFNRPQVLTFPRQPHWLLELQKRFAKEW